MVPDCRDHNNLIVDHLRGHRMGARLRDTVKLYVKKPFLRITRYQCATSHEFLRVPADFPMRLARTSRGHYYWAMCHRGELHWWLLVDFTVAGVGSRGASFWCPKCGRAFLRGGCLHPWHDQNHAENLVKSIDKAKK
jgi:hypothetical protein